MSSIAKKPPQPKQNDIEIENPSSVGVDSASAETSVVPTNMNPPRERLSSGDFHSGTDRRQMLKSRLSSVKDQTKSRMGAAVQSAKDSQRGGRLMAKMAEAKASANAKLGEAATAVRTASDISTASSGMSKLGAQVKSVKLDGGRVTQAMKSVKLDSQALSRLNSSSFQQPHPSFRNNNTSSIGGTSDMGQPSLQIKSLRSLPSAPTVKQSDLPIVELKRIPGKWNVKIEMVRVPEEEMIGVDDKSSENGNEYNGEEKADAGTDANEMDSADVETDGTDTSSFPATKKPFPWRYELTVQPLQTHHSQPTKMTYIKTLEDILEFYSKISHSIFSVQGYDAEYSLDGANPSCSVDFSTVHAALRSQLAVVVHVLHGVLELSEGILESEDVRSYQCEMICAFYNAIFSSPLPEDAIAATLAAFDLFKEAGMPTIKCLDRYEYNASPAANVLPTALSSHDNSTLENLHSLISQCQTELARASRQALLASSLSSSAQRAFVTEKSGAESSLQTSSGGTKVNALHEAMHQALISAKAERDEAHSQLIASSVLHVSEMEDERKKNDSLTRKLVIAEKLNAEAGAGGSFFLGSDEVAQKQNISSGAMHSSDEELLAMCRQLSNEIAEKTNAALEIVRLKESHKIERNTERARRFEMEKEMEELKQQLAIERSKRESAEKQACRWKQSFDEAVSSSGTDTETKE